MSLLEKRKKLNMLYYQQKGHSKFFSFILSTIPKNKLYLPCLEISLTTYCTLCCEKCANLIQYYEKPYHVNGNKVIDDIKMLASTVDVIGCLRLVGGEPLLWPEISKLLDVTNNISNIYNVIIVTNGTLPLTDDVVEKLKKNKKNKISISNYKEKSKSLKILIGQLNKAKINFSVNEVIWKDKSDISYRGKSRYKLCNTYKKCPNKFFSVLNGEIHMCPRSSHGTDLGAVKKRKCDYINISDFYGNFKELRKKIISLINTDYIEACNYCSEDIADQIPIVETAKQCKREYSRKIFLDMTRKDD